MNLRCYACGKSLGLWFYLVSMQDESDRVFVLGAECAKRADVAANGKVLVQKMKGKAKK